MTQHISKEAAAHLRAMHHPGAEANLDAALGRRPSAKDGFVSNSEPRLNHTVELDRNPVGADAYVTRKPRPGHGSTHEVHRTAFEGPQHPAGLMPPSGR
jgi:hypothetical protein